MRYLLLLLMTLFFSISAEARKDPDGKERDFDKREFTCPLGGKKFVQDVGYSSFPLITMPDGSWLGDTEIGVQIPVCPDNGLVLIPDLEKSAASEDSDRILYADYSAAERAQLPALIADPEYAVLKADGRYAQAYWLASKLGRPAFDRFFMLQRATWATREPMLRKRLVGRLAADGAALIDAYDANEAVKRFHLMYVVNALRELGRFDEALALLDKIEQGGPVPGQPDPDSIYGPEEPTGPMRLAIAQKDDGRFAAETLPDRMVNGICDGDRAMVLMYGPTSASTKAACKIKRDREAKQAADSETAFQEALGWRDKSEARDKACVETAVEKQSKGLQMACEYAQKDRDEIAAGELVKDGRALAAQCEATPEKEQQGPLFFGCISYYVSLESALGRALADDEAAWKILCPEGDSSRYVEDRDRHISGACNQAKMAREDNAEKALLADPEKLDKQCAAQPEKDIPMPIYRPCLTRQREIKDAEIEKRAITHAWFEQKCGRYGKTNSAGNDVYDLTDEQEICRSAWRLRENRKAQADAEARGLVCFRNAIYSPERPNCVSKAEFDKEMAVGRDDPKYDINHDNRFSEESSLSQATRESAATIIAKAKAEGIYPKRQSGDRY